MTLTVGAKLHLTSSHTLEWGRMPVQISGSTQLTGEGHSLNPIDNTIPPAVGHDPAPVVFKVSKPIGTSGHHLHF